MKKRLFILFIFFYVNGFVFAQQQILNGNFENWSGGEPDNWNSISTVSQSNDAFQGSYSAKLESASIWGQFIPGLLTNGNIDLVNQSLDGGIPYSDRPDGISFFFKYFPSGTDTMFFAAFLTRWNDVDLKTDTIGFTGYLNSLVFDTYTDVELPFLYGTADIPDTLNVIFLSSGFSGNAGSVLYIDSLSMKNGTIVSPTFCFPATDITSSEFTAHWLSVPGASSYDLDVALDADFTDFVTGYENLNTGIDTFYTVFVTPGTYYYRVRVNYSGGETSINSNTVETLVDASDVDVFLSDDVKVYFDGRDILIKSGKEGSKRYEVYDVAGRVVDEGVFYMFKRIEAGVPGVYLVRVFGGGYQAVKKITVK